MISVGTGFYAMNALMEPFCEKFAWSRTEINVSMSIAGMLIFLCQPFYGLLVIKYGSRCLMTIGPIFGCLAFYFLGKVDSLLFFYIVYSILILSNGAYGGIVSSTAVSNWFVQKRGKALGFASAGQSMGGAVMPLLTMFLILGLGMGAAFTIIGACMLAFSPLAWAAIRDRPEHYGLEPDGLISSARQYLAINPGARPGLKVAGIEPKSLERQGDQAQWGLVSLTRTRNFWLIGLSFGLMMVSVAGVMSQLKPRFSDMGFSPLHAMLLVSATALAGALGKYTWGFFCDHFRPQRVVCFMAMSSAASLILVLTGQKMIFVMLFVIIYGFSMGGVLSTYPIVIAHFYGRTAYPYVARFLSLFFALEIIGYPILGQSYDRFGSYDFAYGFFVFLNVIAGILVINVKKQI